MVCGLTMCECDQVCKTCNFNWEEDEIKTQILCNMKHKELWRKNVSIKTLDEVLGAIRVSEAAIEQQSVLVGQTGRPTTQRWTMSSACTILPQHLIS